MAEENKPDGAATSGTNQQQPQQTQPEEQSKQQDPKPPKQSDPKPPKVEPVKRVEVLVETLGHKLLKKGDVTDDPDYVALLKTPRGRKLVREVK